MRPWARTFDLISSEYGWTDDQILDLTLERIIQIRSVIRERQKETTLTRLRIEEVEMQAIMVAVHGAAGNAAGVQAAIQFRLLPDDQTVKDAPRIGSVTRMFPVSDEGLISPEMIAARRDELGLA